MVPGLGPGVLDQRPPGARYGRTGNLTSPADAQLLLARHFIKPPLWIFLFALSFDLVIRLICLKILWKFLFTMKLLHFGVSQPRKLLRESRTTGALISFPVTPSKLSLTQKDTKCLDAFFYLFFSNTRAQKTRCCSARWNFSAYICRGFQPQRFNKATVQHRLCLRDDDDLKTRRHKWSPIQSLFKCTRAV